MEERGVYSPIADYGVIGDCRTAALISTEASIDWLCAPRFDSPSIFGRLLDLYRGGYWRIRPTGHYHANHHYLDQTNVLVTRFLSDAGVATLTDFMPLARDGVRRAVVRMIDVADGEMEIESTCAPRPDYGRADPALQAQGARLSFAGCALAAAPGTDWQLDEANGAATCTLTLHGGQRAAFVLWLDGEGAGDGMDPTQALDQTVAYWRAWASQCTYDGPYRDEVVRSALALKLLIDAESGAILAAPTTSLPEQPGGPLNWDYRYSWLRDASFTLYALLLAGFEDETAAFFRWIVDTVKMGQDGLQLMYTVGPGETLEEQELDHWEGYQHSRPVRVGNAAAGQLQLDIYGEVLDALFFAWKTGQYDPSGVWDHFVPLVDWIAAHWRAPDNGIWEERGERRHYVYSKVMSWVALDRGIKLAQGNGLPGDVERWAQERDACRAEILTRGWSERLHAFKASYEQDRLDASILRAVAVGFIAGDDPKMAATIERIQERLVTNGLCYRYLGPPEGTFLACTFWLISALVLAGRGDEAREMFENVLHYASPLGLYSEEMDPSSRQLLGNFPQALSHIGVVNAAVALAQAGVTGAVHSAKAAAASEARRSASHAAGT